MSTLLVTVLELLSLLVLHQFGSSFSVIPSGPLGLVFSLLYQFFSLVPATYHFRVFGITFSNKSFAYALALQVNVFAEPRRLRLLTVSFRVSLPSASHGPQRSPRLLDLSPARCIVPTLPASRATDSLLGLSG